MRITAALPLVVVSLAQGACGESRPSRESAVKTTVPGTRTVADPGGSDENVPAYGHPASPAELLEVRSVVIRYYRAAASSDGQAACALLYPPLAGSVPEDYGASSNPAYQRGATCRDVMSKIFARLGGSRADLAATKVVGARIYGRRGFAILRSKHTPHGEIFVERERGKWTIGALIGREIETRPA